MANPADLEVAVVARLARITLNAEEEQLFQSQLAQVLEYAEKLREVDVSGVDPAAHAVPMFNVFRDDEPRASLTVDEALSNAPRQANGLFLVTKVME